MTDSHKLPQFKFEKYVPSKEHTKKASPWRRWLGQKWFRGAIGMVAGAIVGLLYWKFVGCQSGTCPLTSNPYKSMILFSFMGTLLARDKSEAKVEAK